MEKGVFVKLVLVFVAVCSQTAGGRGPVNPNVGSPVGRGTVPATSYSGGLIKAVNPIDRRSNLVITGNVSQGKHFRGVVPYSAPFEFQDSLGTTSLDSFLRRSSGISAEREFSGRLSPYFSSSGTVSITKPGSRGVSFKPPRPRVYGVRSRQSTAELLSQARVSTPVDTELVRPTWPVTDVRFRPLTSDVQELEEVILRKSLQESKGRSLAESQRSEYLKRFRDDLEKDVDQQQRTEIAKQKQLDRQQDDVKVMVDHNDIYGQLRQQFGLLDEDDEEETFVGESPFAEAGDEGKVSEPKQQEETDEEIARQAQRVLGKHKTFASYSEDNFNKHLRAGEKYLKEGKYYRAADAYTLASIYKPTNPLALAGKSHALLAAGEYMSSALFLSRAIEIFPEYVLVKIDVDIMIGDRDNLESRIADIKRWAEKSSSGELEFLLGYVYYQMDRLIWARRAIDSAYEKMPNSMAVAVLKQAIENADK
ncbi:tetratricopeptide repeat protein [Planctomycetota bacterium]